MFVVKNKWTNEVYGNFSSKLKAKQFMFQRLLREKNFENNTYFVYDAAGSEFGMGALESWFRVYAK
ncbi:MAG TPA: hypothetical protein EYO59_02885, partial [Chromatiaceae bacterium]|nr:hypothetical protein [Chromatiaceae bacterium]